MGCARTTMIPKILAALILALGLLPAAVRAEGLCGMGCFSCQKFHCPPALKHCMERAPCIKWYCGCPKPVVNPCEMPTWGYFQTCWTPWPWQNDCSYCPVPPPSAFVVPNPRGVYEPGGTYFQDPAFQQQYRGETLPLPKSPNQ